MQLELKLNNKIYLVVIYRLGCLCNNTFISRDIEGFDKNEIPYFIYCCAGMGFFRPDAAVLLWSQNFLIYFQVSSAIITKPETIVSQHCELYFD